MQESELYEWQVAISGFAQKGLKKRLFSIPIVKLHEFIMHCQLSIMLSLEYTKKEVPGGALKFG